MMSWPSLKSNAVIASAAWQSSSLKTQSNSGLLRRFAPRNDEQLSLRATKSRGNPFLVLITLLTLCFSQCQAAVEFDGVDDYITLNGFNMSNFSISAWVKIPNPTVTYRGIVEFSDAANQRRGIGLNTDGSPLITYGANRFKISTSGDINDNTWHHLVSIYNGTNASIYDNNTLVILGAELAAGVASLANDLKIGTFTVTPTVYELDGSMDDVRIYNRALSAPEVEALYKAKLKRTGGNLTNGLVAHLEMDDDAIGEVTAQAKDSSGNLRHGQFIGFNNLVYNGFSSDVPVQIGTGLSLEFDGTNGYIDTIDDGPSNGVGPFHFDDAEDWSITIWYKGSDNEINSEWGKALMGRDNNDLWANLVLRNGRVEYIHHNSPWQHNIISNNTVTDNQWHFISYVNHSNATGDLYIDSNPDIVGASSVFDDASRRYVVSSLMKGYNNKFTNGLIDDARIYNRALTASEISFLYNGSGMDPGTSNLQALWTFDDDSALKDSSGNNNHGLGIGGDSLKYTEGVLKR